MSNKVIAEQTADVVDVNEPAVPNSVEETSEDTTVVNQETAEVKTEEAPAEFKVPEKFEGKSIEDIIQSYENLEKAHGKRGNELGEMRKLADQLLELQLDKKDEKPTEEPEGSKVDLDSLLDDPEVAVNQLIESNPRLKAIEEHILQEQRGQSKSALDAKHPNWEITAGSQEFQQWVQGSRVRAKMFQDAHVNYDYELAGELFDMYQLTQREVPQEQEATKVAEVEKQATETGSTGNAPTKVYRRADLMNLRLTDPKKYEAMEDDIILAYAQGRVR